MKIVSRYLLPLLVSTTASSFAAVILDGSVTFTTDPNPSNLVRQNTYTFDNTTDLGGFDPTGSDKLVVVFGSENANGIDSITYGGVALNLALYRDGSHELAVYYLDNPTTNGDLFVNPSGGSVNGLGGAIFSLSNTVDGFDASNSSAGGSTSVTADQGSFVVGIGVKNQGTPPGANSPLTEVFSSGSGSSATGVRYVIPGVTGSVTASFTQSPTFTGAVEFEAVPEPTAALLGGLGSLLLLRRRKS